MGQPYRDARLSIEERLDDLLQRMTLKEKQAQLLCPLGWLYDAQADTVGVGMLWATFRADPWTGRTLSDGLRPRTAASRANELQRHALENTRLGIPLLLAEEAPHGHMAIGTTTFPTGLALGATFSPQLIERMGKAILSELRSQGAHLAFGPVLDLGRDPRWSRTEETFGEDPCLAGALGAAMVRGMEGQCVLKHLVAYGMGLGGQNGAPISMGQNELCEVYLPPFRQAVAAGAVGVMTAYNAVDGVPSTANPWLLRDVLRHQWGFRGLVLSDLYSINVLHNTLHAASSLQEAASMALAAGVDVDLGASAYSVLSLATQPATGNMEELLDEAVRRVLRIKFQLGLFEHPYVDEQLADSVNCPAHRQLALDIARACVTLLYNDGVLPLDSKQRIALVGPNADAPYAQLGDYTAPQPEGKVVTVREGLLSKGFQLVDPGQADVIVAVVGGSSSRYQGPTEYEETGAAATTPDEGRKEWTVDSGEGLDRMTLDLPDSQQRLLNAMKQTGKPLVVVYIEGRPLLKNWAAANANAVLTAFYPGEQGGTALADVLAGDYNPAGRLPVSVPRNVGQLPVYYNRPLPLPHNYVEGTGAALYPFGHGLSYTTFAYSDLHVQGRQVSFVVTNTGSRDGEEVAQLYLQRRGTGRVEPERQLVDFERVSIPRGQQRLVSLTLPDEGPGNILVGTSSQDIRLTASLIPSPEIPTNKPEAEGTDKHVAPRGDIVEADAAQQAGRDKGNEYEWPADSLVAAQLRTWQDLKFGILLHWGLYSVPGIVESWSICDEDWIRRDTTRTYDQYKRWYWSLADSLRPTSFSPNQWAEVAQAAGMRYMLFTTKHHDGFCLFDSHETDFSLAHHAGLDALKPVLQAFRQRGMMTGTYFSKPDWHAQTYWWDVYPTKGRNVNYPIDQYPDRWHRFQQFTYAQIEEILSRYGRVDILWLDGGWVCAANHQDIDMPRIAQMARHHQPGIIIVDRTIHGPYENYRTPERTVPDTLLPYPWESCIPLSDDWGWVPRPRWKSAQQVVNLLIEVVAKGGNLVLGVGPTADGLIEPEAETRLRQIGRWLQRNGSAIYNTRPLEGAPLPNGDSTGGRLWFATSKDGHMVYALLALPEGSTVPKTVEWHGIHPRRNAPVRLLATGQRLKWRERNGSIEVVLPRNLPSEPLVIAFER